MPTMTPVACAVPRCPYPATRRGRCDQHHRTTSERGYGSAHQGARQQLARTLPAPCGYCGGRITPAEPWVAAHRVDGKPQFGYVVAHGACNERAKDRPIESLRAGVSQMTHAPFRER